MKHSTDSGLVKYIAAIVAIVMLSTLASFVVLSVLNDSASSDAAEIVKLVVPSGIGSLVGMAVGGAISGDKK